MLLPYFSINVQYFSTVSVLLSGLCAIFLLSACQTSMPFNDKEPINVGILHSMTGTTAAIEQPVVNATLMAIDEINTQGGYWVAR
jgi:urea transport system substrate-binding protein